jgi:hypothetical protein
MDKLTPDIADDTQNLAPSTFMKEPEVKLPTAHPAHGKPWRVYEYNCNTSVVNAAGDEVAVFDSDKDADCAIECVNKLMLHPDLSAVEVHSKETMDEVKATLEKVISREYRFIMDGDEPASKEQQTFLQIVESALAKLNPPL